MTDGYELKMHDRMAGQMLNECRSGDTEELRSETHEQWKWVHRVLELRTGGKLSIGSFFVLFFRFCSVLFPMHHYFFGSRPGENGVSTGFTTCHRRRSFPVCKVHVKVTQSLTDPLWDLGVHSITYVG